MAGLLYLYLVGVVTGTLLNGTPTLADPVAEPLLFPVAFVWTPPTVAAVHAHRGGGLAGAFGVAVDVTVAVVALGWADGRPGAGPPGGSLALAPADGSGATAVVGVVVGFVAGTVARALRTRPGGGSQSSS